MTFRNYRTLKVTQSDFTSARYSAVARLKRKFVWKRSALSSMIKNGMSAMMQNLLEKFLFKIINFIERYNRLRVSTMRKNLVSVFYWLFLHKDVYIISYLLLKCLVVYAFYISEFNYDWNHSRPEESMAIRINLIDIFALLTDD